MLPLDGKNFYCFLCVYFAPFWAQDPVPSVGVGAYLDEKFYCDYAREESLPYFLEYSEFDGTGVASSSILSRDI